MQPANSQQSKTQKAFTLIELLVVIAIIGILAGMVVVNMSGATESARVAKSINFASSIQHSLGVNCVGDWEFDEGLGSSANDSSGSNNPGNIVGAVYSTSTPYGTGAAGRYALSFDGNSYVEVPGDGLGDVLSELSISVWAKAVKGGDYGYIVHRSMSSAIGSSVYWIGINSLGNYAGAISGRYSQGYTDVPADGSTWNFLVLTYDGNTQKVYVDTKLKASYSLGAITNSTSSNRIAFGSTPFSVPYRPVIGLIDQVRIYNKTMTASNIRQDYLAGLGHLLASGQVTEEEYQKKLAELDIIYAINE